MQLSRHDREIIARVYHFINCNFRDHITITTFTRQYNIAKTTLTEGFKMIYGYTMYQYRLIISMEYAKSKIESGTRIKDVQKELGYKTSGSFARAYKKIFGGQPSKISLFIQKNALGTKNTKMIFWFLCFH